VVEGMRVFIHLGEEIRKHQVEGPSNATDKTIIRTIMRDLGIQNPPGFKKPLYQFLMANFAELKNVVPTSVSHTHQATSRQRIVITAATSINQSEEQKGNDDAAALRIKMLLDLRNMDSVIQDSSDLKNKMLRGEVELPEPMICVGPPERNFFTGMLGQNRVTVSRKPLGKYYGNLKSSQIEIYKVTGKAIYVVFAVSRKHQEKACQMVVDMIADGVIGLRPGCPDRGDKLPPIKWGNSKK